MTHNGFENWFNRAIDLADDATKNRSARLKDPIIFHTKSGRSIETNLETFFNCTTEIGDDDNITVYKPGKGNFVYEIDIDSIEFIEW